MIISNLAMARQAKINHGNGQKFVFEEQGWDALTITQAAFGMIKAGELCDLHAHHSMIEVFYFIDGEGFYRIEENEYIVEAGVYLRIDPGEFHELRVTRDLHFFYIGIRS